jgi:murein L,D-transpeptidase YcbB/YkuD
MSLLQRQTDATELLHALSPQDKAYQRLRGALHDYRVLASQGGWPELPEFPTLRPGEQRPEVPLVRRRLQLEGDHPAFEPMQAELFDDTLETAVKRFQSRNGLVEDGVVGAKTLAALNVKVEDRIDQIRANMERWRWLPRELGKQYLLVNTAGYELTLFLDGQPVMQQRTINGTQKRQTPSFASRITHLVVNPKWTVPRLIAVKDLLPKQQRDVEYLSQMGIRVLSYEEGEWIQHDPLSIDWQQYNKNYFPFTLRQVPGEKNSLGRIKFVMDNPFAIYLHDTPAKRLFEKPIRAFSSGCIRVQGVDQLARELLLNGGQSPDVALDEPLNGLETRTQRLKRPMPVYLVYFTSWVDDTGLVHFRPDVYQRNQNLLVALRADNAKVTAVDYPDNVNPL